MRFSNFALLSETVNGVTSLTPAPNPDTPHAGTRSLLFVPHQRHPQLLYLALYIEEVKPYYSSTDKSDMCIAIKYNFILQVLMLLHADINLLKYILLFVPPHILVDY